MIVQAIGKYVAKLRIEFEAKYHTYPTHLLVSMLDAMFLSRVAMEALSDGRAGHSECFANLILITTNNSMTEPRVCLI